MKKIYDNSLNLLFYLILISLLTFIGLSHKVIFHSIAEIISIIIGVTIFILVWNTRNYLKNDFLFSLGVGYLYISILDLFHTLTYPEFVSAKSFLHVNISVTFWIMARTFESIFWFTSVFWLKQKINKNKLMAVTGIITCILVYLNLGTSYLPSAITPDLKANSFRKIYELVNNIILLIAAINFLKYKSFFKREVFKYILIALLILVLIGFIFSSYTGGGLGNLLGWHLGKIISFIILYRIILQNGLREPFSIMFHELKNTQKDLIQHQEGLTDLVKEKTNDLIDLNYKFKEVSKSIPGAIFELTIIEQKMSFTFISEGSFFNSSEVILFKEKFENFYNYIEQTDQNKFKDLFNKNNLGHSTLDFKFIRNNSDFWIRCVVKNNNDNFFGVFLDITKEMQNKIEKDQIKLQLIESQKMEAIGTIAGGIAHDFNNILHGISSSLELVNLKNEPNIDTANNLINKGKALIFKILHFSSRKQISVTSVDLYTFVNNLETFLESFIPSNIDFNLEKIDRSNDYIFDVSVNELEQVFLNLIINAIHSMPNGGIVIVKTSLIEKKYVEFSVIDNGAGISEDIINKIFDPYFTTKKVGKGTGLGLSVVKGIIANFGGQILVSSEIGIGTRFKITLPIYIKNESFPKKAVDSIKDEINITSENNDSNKTELKKEIMVWLVEDDLMLLNLIAKQISSFGFLTKTFTDGNELIKLLELETPDIVVSDYMMPKINGAELITQIRKTHSLLPVLVISGFIKEDDYIKIKESKLTDVLSKPFSKDSLYESIMNQLKNI